MNRQIETQLLASWLQGDNKGDLRYFEPRDFKEDHNAELVRMLKEGKTTIELLKAYGDEYTRITLERLPSLYEPSFTQATEDLRRRYVKEEDGVENIVEKLEALDARLKGSLPTKEERVTGTLELMRAKIEDGTAPTIIPTGFPTLDKQIDGGLRAGLYIVGAISSLGKTSFCIQLADNIAKAGKPVLFVSLEMAREELIAKILSRLTFEISQAKGNRNRDAKTTIKILNTHEHSSYKLTEQATIKEAFKELGSRGDKLLIYEGIGDVTASRIKAKAKQVEKLSGEAPVVVVDYLQILAPEEGYKLTDKQATDKNVLELKRLSRDLNTPVICVSSFNRDNYNEPVGLSSFKESGAIEYGADVLLGIQLAGMDYEKGEVEKSTKRRDRIKQIRTTAEENGRSGKAQALELKVLKNRNGSRGAVRLEFVPMFNSFKDAGKVEELDYENDFIRDDDLPIL